MKVVYIAKFNKFYNTGNYVANAFTKQSVQVVKISPETKFKEVKRIISNEQPDFVLYGKVLKIDKLIPWLKNVGVLSVFWLYDMAWGSSPVADINRNHILKMNIHESDLFFSTDGGHDKEWTTLGVKHITLRQGIHAPDHKLVSCVDVDFDILFTGCLYFPLRNKMIAFLKRKYGNKFNHITSGLRGIELNKAIRSTKIVIADSYPSPRYWSNRVYEMVGRGGFVLHSAIDGLHEEFQSGRDIITFPYNGQHDQLESIVDKCLGDNYDREQICMNGFNRCPTYDDRISVMLLHIKSVIGEKL